MKFLIATKNAGKHEEFKRMLALYGIEAVSGQEIGKEIPDTAETGETFEENARLKALDAKRETGYDAVLADDSGLEVDALNGEPGIYTARYAGIHGDSERNIEKLLKKLEGVPAERRSARFVCALCALLPGGKSISVKGCWEGCIGFSKAGDNGFGYDPVFVIPDGRTAAELENEEKDSLSHRHDAIKKLKAELDRLNLI